MNASARQSRAMGWVLLCVFACMGVALETAHAFKIAAYLDDSTTRLLLTLAHAHGVGLALILLAHAATSAQLSSGRALQIGAVLIPLGFIAGAVGHPESDPSIGIVLVPIGALVLLVGLVRVALAAIRAAKGAS